MVAGSRYVCTLSANNTIGGLDETSYYTDFGSISTGAIAPDDVDAGTMSCATETTNAALGPSGQTPYEVAGKSTLPGDYEVTTR